MAQAGVISGYLDALGEALAFDRALSRAVRQEVEDHLQETVAADPTPDRTEAERRAVANFGQADALAEQFAAVSLARRSKIVGFAVVMAVGVVLVAMRARVTWFSMVEWPPAEGARPFREAVFAIDRYGFWLAAVFGLAAMALIARRGAPVGLSGDYRRHLRRSLALCAAAGAALIVSVASDAVLTALRIGAGAWGAASLVPLALMAVEVACAAAIMMLIGGATRRVARALVRQKA